MAYMFLYVDMNIHMIQQPRIQQQLGKKGRSCYADTHTHTHTQTENCNGTYFLNNQSFITYTQ